MKNHHAAPLFSLRGQLIYRSETKVKKGEFEQLKQLPLKQTHPK